MTKLTFNELRKANLARLPHFKNPNGDQCHTVPDGSDWPLSKWNNAILGELGEFANIIKKVERGDFTIAEVRQELAHELADIQTYLDITAYQCGIDLGAATVEKFNIVSEKIKYEGKL